MNSSLQYLLRTIRPALVASLVGAACVVSGPTAATAQVLTNGSLPWPQAPYSQFVKNKTLDRVLRDFAASFSLGIALPSGLESPVSGRFSTATPTEFLNRLGRQYGLTWYVHGGVLHVARVRDSVVKALAVPTVGGNNSVRQVLTDLQVFEPRFGWSEIPEQGMAIVTGPRSYVELIERTIASLPQAPGGQQVVMFRLRHASVDDRVISYRDREIVVPGVATVLRNLMQMNVPGQVRAGSPTGNSGAGLASVSASLGGSRPNGAVASGVGGGAPGYLAEAPFGSMSASGGSGAGPNSSGSAGTGSPGMGSGGAGGAGAGNPNVSGGQGSGGAVSMQARPRPSIQSDPRLNAVIIQDAPDRIPLYTSLIAQMDVPAPLIEIEAMIVDVNTSRLEELGIAWGTRYGGGTGAAGYGNVTAAPDGNTLSIIKGNAGVATPTATVLDTASRYLVARIRALEQQGDASIQARPSIITSENIGAVIDLSETVYIQTTAERTALVTPVTAGTTLRVTPRLSQRGDAPAIFMTVDIEDGQVQNSSSGGLPSVRKGVVSTEATLSGEQSLLIGGYNSEQRVVGRAKVPLLGDVPGFGALFSNRSDSVQRRERLFLLKARVMQPERQAAAEAAGASTAVAAAPPVQTLAGPRVVPERASAVPSTVRN